MFTISSGHLSTRVRDRERDRDRKRESTRVRYGTTRPRRLWPVWKCLFDPIRNWTGRKLICPENGTTTLTGYPVISRPAAGSITAMPPRFTNGRRRTPPRNPRKRAYPTTHARRARVYEERNQRCFGKYDGHHTGAVGLHQRGRFAALRQVPQTKRSLFPG